MRDFKIPGDYRQRLKDAAARHGFASPEALADHLVDRGLARYGASGRDRFQKVVDEYGYSSTAEVVEHLLERGLRAYEDAETDPEKLAARLRGLGYID